ncbi:type II CRISPR-associated endonuclease Cas1 [Bifidobacterium choloepi]|uniref:CRISPR-associated endonuclease Cas1 n=1 Tax=Bifidobacterium choloepi TaxID=2614131 RepID=A0A6I5N9N1_9BIFI|nr:type II CRISPR-associated endonuclease Cas1 [Bifidobacterium choloepi]NEG69210.1 type II CRISPR-associated endonuclease Cas1 [Bifidobacterium choloepi]
MTWRTVAIITQSKISSKNNLLIIQNDDGVHSVPLSDIGTVLINSTRSVITTHAIDELLKKDIRIICCDDKGFPNGQIMPKRSSTGRRQKIMMQMHWDQLRKDRLWQHIIQEKIRIQAQTLEYLDIGKTSELFSLIAQVTPGDADNREAVASHLYFPRLFSYEFTRNDEEQNINSLLNYGYAIILSEVSRCIALHGYLNEFGIHHDNDHNPYNLACDLMEPFRPFVDEEAFAIGSTPLTPEIKQRLIRLLRRDNDRLRTSLAVAIEGFVSKALRYLREENAELPQVRSFAE